MSVREQIRENDGLHFITFTCYKWLHLIDKVNGYDIVYSQFDHLQKQGHFVAGYVIMPNHLHVLIAFKNTGKTINGIVGNIKRFMAYEIVKRLQAGNEAYKLEILTAGINATDKSRGKLHAVFEPSFDCKECYGNGFINQKLDYMHNNPFTGIWNLAHSAVEYPHSSAIFYITGALYKVKNHLALDDIDLSGGID